MAGMFCVDWWGGAAAQVEIFSPPPSSVNDVYQLRYTPAFRSTLRPPVEERPLGSGDLAPINAQLNELGTALRSRFGGAVAAPAEEAAQKSIGTMEMVGQQLFALVIPGYVQGELRTSELFLEIGMDETLLEYPWELMHDGENFLCLKHAVGRFVNRTAVSPLAQQAVSRAEFPGELTILLVSVPAPQPREGKTYDRLPEADAETNAILNTLGRLPGVKLNVLIGKDATYNELFKALKGGPYHIIHFNGHAYFNDAKPRDSGLVLYDADMKAGAVAGYLGRRAPILCFVNACETAKTGKWSEQYSIFGLARAFLETGTYLLGSRWRINDRAAAEFATEFYRVLIEQKAVGRAILQARQKCKAAGTDDVAWASYVFYGDPRMYFRASDT